MLDLNERTYRETVELTRALVRIPSENPPGNEDAVIDFVTAFLDDTGIAYERVPLEEGRSSLVARIEGKAHGSLALCGHVDTVRAEPSQWTFDPFSGALDGDRLLGLGAADMKGGVAVMLQIGRELRRQSVQPVHDLVLALTADEEKAYRGAASLAAEGFFDDAHALLIPEPTAGRAYFGQKGELWLRARFMGSEAHGSMPEEGHSAVDPAAEFCLAIRKEADGFPRVTGRGRTSLNIGQVQAGRQINIVAGEAAVSLDIRVVSEEERERVIRLVQRLGSDIAARHGVGFDLDVTNDQRPIVSDPRNNMVEQFAACYERETGRSAGREIVGYSTDAVEIVPRVEMPLIVFGPGDIRSAHRPDESVQLESLYEAVRVVGRFVAGSG